MRKPVAVLVAILGMPLSLHGTERPEIFVEGGPFSMGTTDGERDEQPIVDRRVASFYLDKSPVSVAEFSAFVQASGYQTTAETLGDSAVFDMTTGLWSLVAGAEFRYPLGPEGSLAELDHPVTHVSWYDAKAFCKHSDRRLPTEAEFEFAARGGGNDDPIYAFGDSEVRDGDFLVNVYTGFFPFKNTAEDGYVYTAPIGKTGLTPLGFTDMAGNVWEWSQDWYQPYSQTAAMGNPTEKAQRGGSFLCDKDFCHGYRTTARSHSTPDSSFVHVGFRCARSAR